MEARPDAELDAMRVALSALEPLNEDARARVISWIAGRLEMKSSIAPATPQRVVDLAHNSEQDAAGTRPRSTLESFETLGELVAAADPKTDAHRVLIAAYWIQIRAGVPDFESQPVNAELKHLGYKVSNITSAIDALKNQKPQLVVQTRKNGQAKQARKKFKVTEQGVRAVEAMLQGNDD